MKNVIDLDKFIRDQIKRQREREGGVEVRISIFHADNIFQVYRNQKPWYVKSQWWNFKVYHETLIDNEDSWWDCGEDLIQARHFLIGLTAALKDMLEWDWLKQQPADEAPNYATRN